MALAKTPFGKPNKAKTWKDVNGKLPAIPIRVYGPPPTSGTRDALDELIMTAGCEANAGMVALKKANADQVQGDLHRHSRGRRLHRGRRERQSDRPEARRQPRTRSASSATASSKRIRAKLKGVSINGVAADLSDDQRLQISGRASALHLCQECARPGDPGDPRLRRRIHQGKRDRARMATCKQLAWLPLRTRSAPSRSRPRGP